MRYVVLLEELLCLLFYGSTILPFVDHFPKNTELYRIMTTKPQELKKEDERVKNKVDFWAHLYKGS